MGPGDPVLAIDIGGTKIAAGVVEPGGRLASWAQAETPRGLEAEQLWRTLDALCTNLLAEQRIDARDGLAGVGCGCNTSCSGRSSSRHGPSPPASACRLTSTDPSTQMARPRSIRASSRLGSPIDIAAAT